MIAPAMRLAIVLALGLLLASGAPVRAQEAGGGPGADEPGSGVAAVIDGDTLVLETGEEVRLLGIQAPKLALGRPDFVPWPCAEEAKRALERLVRGQRLSLADGARAHDRYGRRLAHLHRADGLWVQGALLEAGWARVYSFADNRALVAEMLARERAARAAGRGIWADPFYRVRTPEEAAQAIGSFQLVEGRVLAAAIVKGRGYLNFGPDWKTDFTLAAEKAALKLFAAAGIDFESLAGHDVRVRGWIKDFNGPLIEATHPEQIEILP